SLYRAIRTRRRSRALRAGAHSRRVALRQLPREERRVADPALRRRETGREDHRDHRPPSRLPTTGPLQSAPGLSVDGLGHAGRDGSAHVLLLPGRRTAVSDGGSHGIPILDILRSRRWRVLRRARLTSTTSSGSARGVTTLTASL